MLDQLMTARRVGIYAGIDPTATSLHVGHLLPLMVLYWAYIKGYYSCSLVRNLLFLSLCKTDTFSSEGQLLRLEILSVVHQLEILKNPLCEKRIWPTYITN